MEANVVMVEEVQHIFEVELIEVTKKLIKCKLDDNFDYRYINENDEWWKENRQLFQKNFNLFFRIKNSN